MNGVGDKTFLFMRTALSTVMTVANTPDAAKARQLTSLSGVAAFTT
jgi:hypothetical protein